MSTRRLVCLLIVLALAGLIPSGDSGGVTTTTPMYPGTNSDLEVVVQVDGITLSPNAVGTATCGQQIIIDTTSPGGTYYGDPFIVSLWLHDGTEDPIGLPPGYHVDLSDPDTVVIESESCGESPFGPQQITVQGNLVIVSIPEGMEGYRIRIQSFAHDASTGETVSTDAYQVEVI